jgi:endonuclease/exonuclease/phosphatase family metal-dependent hydrolase
MKRVLKILLSPILVVNLLAAIGLIGCAYSPLLPAEKMPLLSLAGLAFPFVLAANVCFLVLWIFVYRRYALVSLVTFLLCIPQMRAFFPINIGQQNSPKESIKVLSYNVLIFNIDASNTTKENATISYLEESDADIICLQELQFNILKHRKQLLKKYPYKSYELSKESQAAAHHLACLSKFPILSIEQLKLESTTNGCAKYHILHEGDTSVVYNCHLQSNGLQETDKSTYKQLLTNPKENIRSSKTKDLVKKLRNAAVKRADQTDFIMADLKKESSPYIIVCGDFNDSPISYTCNRLRRRLDDAYIKSGNGPGISYNRHGMYYRIDHILHSPQFKAYDCTVDRTFKESDHYPIFCFLRKEKE